MININNHEKTIEKSRKFCVFCNLLENKEKNLIHKDEEIFAFHSKKLDSAKVHILICPIIHIKDVSELNYTHISLLEKMKKLAENVLLKLDLNNSNTYRFSYYFFTFSIFLFIIFS